MTTIKRFQLTIDKIDRYRTKNPLEFNELFTSYKLDVSSEFAINKIQLNDEIFPRHYVAICYIHARHKGAITPLIIFIQARPCILNRWGNSIINETVGSYYRLLVKRNGKIIPTNDSIGGMERYRKDPFFTDSINILMKLEIINKDLEFNDLA